jgi:hypothetical protein
MVTPGRRSRLRWIPLLYRLVRSIYRQIELRITDDLFNATDQFLNLSSFFLRIP